MTKLMNTNVDRFVRASVGVACFVLCSAIILNTWGWVAESVIK